MLVTVAVTKVPAGMDWPAPQVNTTVKVLPGKLTLVGSAVDNGQFPANRATLAIEIVWLGAAVTARVNVPPANVVAVGELEQVVVLPAAAARRPQLPGV